MRAVYNNSPDVHDNRYEPIGMAGCRGGEEGAGARGDAQRGASERAPETPAPDCHPAACHRLSQARP